MHNTIRSFYSSKPRLEVNMNFNTSNYYIGEQEIFETVYYISFLIIAINVFCDKNDLFGLTNLYKSRKQKSDSTIIQQIVRIYTIKIKLCNLFAISCCFT